MKKKNPGADNNQPKNKKKMPQKDNSTPKNLPPKEDMPLNHEKEDKKQNPPSPHKKPYQQESQGIDQNVIPEHTGRIPEERREEVEEKSKNI